MRLIIGLKRRPAGLLDTHKTAHASNNIPARIMGSNVCQNPGLINTAARI
jgi:hypothetical protein